MCWPSQLCVSYDIVAWVLFDEELFGDCLVAARSDLETYEELVLKVRQRRYESPPHTQKYSLGCSAASAVYNFCCCRLRLQCIGINPISAKTDLLSVKFHFQPPSLLSNFQYTVRDVFQNSRHFHPCFCCRTGRRRENNVSYAYP